MGRFELQRIISELRDSFRCPECGKKFPLSHIEFRGSLGNTYFLSMQCTDHMPVMVLAKIKNQNNAFVIEKSLQVMEDDAIDFTQNITVYKGTLREAIKNGH